MDKRKIEMCAILGKLIDLNLDPYPSRTRRDNHKIKHGEDNFTEIVNNSKIKAS